MEAQSDRQEIETRLVFAAKMMRDNPAVTGAGIGILGFSLGAFYGLELAVHPELEFIRAVALNYGNNPSIESADYSRSRAAFLGHYAEMDEFESSDGVEKTFEKIEHAGRQVQFYTYPGTQHWFAESDRADAFNPDAASLAWDRTVDFLSQHLIKSR